MYPLMFKIPLSYFKVASTWSSSKGWTSGTQRSRRINFQNKLNPHGEWMISWLSKMTTTLTYQEYRKTKIKVLKCPNHHIHLKFRSGWWRDDSDSACLKRKFATQIDEMILRESREMNYGRKLQNMSWFCYKPVNTLSKTKHYHMEVL